MRFALASLIDSLPRHGDGIAIVEVSGERLRPCSYQQLARRTHTASEGLRAWGLRPGERVGIFAPNSANWVAARLAIAAAGGVAVPIDDLAGADEAAAIIRSSGMHRLLTVRAHLPDLDPLIRDEAVQVQLIDDESWPDAAVPAAAPATLPNSTAENSSAEEGTTGNSTAENSTTNDAAVLVYTSGTTGTPKAFLLSNAAIESNVQAIAAFGLVSSGDRMLMPLPLHHVYPFVVGLLVPLSLGATVILPEGATGPHIVRALGLGRATVMIGVPRLYEALVAGMEAQVKARGRLAAALFSGLLGISIAARQRLGWSLGARLFPQVHARLGPELRLLVSAGAKLAPDVIWKLEGLGFTTLTGYGLAETASAFTGNVPEARRIGSEGRPLVPGAEVRIADPDADGQGEIQLRGPTVFAGYIDNPQATREAFTADGWFRTGDLGSVDADGFVSVTGRLKELIVLGGGKNVFPESLEARYGASPFIREVAVLERQGALVALVLPDAEAIRRSQNTGVEDVIRVALATAAKELPGHERLSGFALVREPLPRTRLGKYQRFLLPRLYAEALAGGSKRAAKPLSEADRALLSAPAAAAAWAVLQGRYADRGLSLDADPQLDLGIDSLEWLSLGLELESVLGIRIAEQDFAGISDVRALLSLLQATAGADAGSPAAAAEEQARAAQFERDATDWLAPQTTVETAAARLLFGLNLLLARLFFRLRVRGLEHLPASAPFVIVANHASDLDPPLMAAALPAAQARHVYWSGDRGRLFGSRIQRWFARATRIFPVDERAPRATLAMAGLVLDAGHALVWFPESWRSPDGRLQRFLPGLGRLLAAHPVPAVPAYIDGTFQAMPRQRRWPRPHPVTITFGPPVAPEAWATQAGEGDAAFARIVDELRDAVARLAPEAAAGASAQPVRD